MCVPALSGAITKFICGFSSFLIQTLQSDVCVCVSPRAQAKKKNTEIQNPRIAQHEFVWHDDRSASRRKKRDIEFFMFFPKTTLKNTDL